MPSPHLERKLKEVLGDDAGQELSAVIDRIDPIRGDIAELRHHMDASFAALSAQFRLALVVLVAAIVGLYVIALMR